MISRKPHHGPTYLAMRQAVGWIGVLLPVVLIVGNTVVFAGDPLPHSISRFDYTGMRDVFVGGLAGIVAAAAHAMFWECDKSECAFVMITEVISLEAFGVSWLLAGRTLKSVESEESATGAASSA